MAAAEELVTRIFRDVIERGNEAITQAEDVAVSDDDMGWQLLKAGQSLVKEGERATKRLRPLLTDRGDDYNDAIKRMMVQNGDILERQRALDSMLYDFDDYMDVDSFEPDKFTELQSATKALALLIMETMRKLMAEPTAKTEALLPPPAPRPTAFPPLPPLPPTAPALRPESRSNVRPATQGRDRPPMSLWPKAGPGPGPKITRQRSGSAGHSGLPSPTSGSEYRPTPLRPPPSPRSTPRQTDGDAGKFDFGGLHRPPQLSHRPSHTDLRDDMERLRLADTLRLPSDKKHGTPPPQTSPDHDPYAEHPSTYNDRRYTATSSDRQSSNYDATSPLSTSNRTSAFSNATSYTSPTRLSNTASFGIPRSSSLKTSELREKNVQSLADQQSGLMLVEEWASTHTSTTHSTSATGYPSWRRVDTSLGVDCSLIAMKGFCKGALLFADGGPGDGVKKVGGAGEAALQAADFSLGMHGGGALAATGARFADTMAQCNRCEYAHKYAQLTQDLDRDPLATLQAHGLRYRRRFLYKSHLPCSIMTKARYGCPFCARTGSTPREGDATVFSSAAQLLRHVARHPQPLPDVPGFTVLYGSLAGEDLGANDFDVHLPSPPAAPGGPPEADAGKVSMLPAFVAVKDHVQLPGERALERPEKTTTTPLLEFFAGARVVGVEFPEQWGGRWCTGWHDGEFGAFPARAGQLEAPRRGRMAGQGPPSSRRSCVTRWKWDHKAGGTGTGWLGFEKGETISNLEWDDADAWYWVGMNRKGKYGIFPCSHVKMDSVRDASLEGSGSVKTKKSILPW